MISVLFLCSANLDPVLVRAGDEACREWLAWRGLAGALRSFDADVAGVPGLAVDRLAELVFGVYTAAPGLDSRALCSLLDFLGQRFFARLDTSWSTDVRKLQSSVLKLFVVRALQAGRRDKVTEVRCSRCGVCAS